MQTAKQLTTNPEAQSTIPSIDKTLLLKVDDYGTVPVYASVTCYFIAKLYKPLQRQQLILKALKAFAKQSRHDRDGRQLRVIRPIATTDYSCLWALRDDEAIILVFPEDCETLPTITHKEPHHDITIQS